MSIWNKILIGLILVASLVFFFFAARTLKVHAAWRKSALDHQAAIASLEKKNLILQEGDPEVTGSMGIRQIKLEIEKRGRQRPRIWQGCTVRSVDAATGAAGVGVDVPNPHQIDKKTVLYVFDENEVPQGGCYLGKFTVTDVADKMVQLVPSVKMTPAELARLKKSKGPWSLYENLPVDDRELFADWDEATKKAMLPATTVAQYIQDGPGGAERKLRAYEVLFGIYLTQRSKTADLTEAATEDLQYLTAAVTDAKQHEKFLEGVGKRLKAELAALQGQINVLLAHSKAVQEKLAQVKAAIEETARQNQAAAAEMTQTQMKAAQLIDEKTRKMAQAGGGG